MSVSKYLLICTSFLIVSTTPGAQRTWDGGGNDGDWRTAQNWDGNIFLPIPIAQGDTLMFPAGPTKLVSTNDFGAGTNFTALVFSGDDYIVRGNMIGLTNGISVTHASGGTTLYLPITLRDDQSFTVSSASAFLYLNGDIAIGQNTLTFDGAGNCVLIGEISNAHIGLRNTVRKSGTGRLTIFQPTSHDVPTIVNEGTLAVESRMTNSAATVNAGGTLRGSGRIGPLNGNGGIIAPGGTTPDTLECYGDVTLGAGTTLRLRLNGTTAGVTYDQLEVKGTVTVGGTLEITPGFLPTVGDRFTIIDNDGSDDIVGTFDGLPDGAIFTVNGRPYQIDYGRRDFFRHNDVVIEAVPALVTWDGGGELNNRWSVPENWVNDILPLPGDDVQFATGGLLTTMNDFPAGRAFGAMILAGGNHRVEGNVAAFAGGIHLTQPGDLDMRMPLLLSGGLDLPHRTRTTLRAPTTCNGNQTFRLSHSNAFLFVTGNIDVGPFTLTIDTASEAFSGLNPVLASAYLAGIVSGPGRMIKTGPEGLYLYGTNHCSETIVNAGILHMDVNSLISGALTINSNAIVEAVDCTGKTTVNRGGVLSRGRELEDVDVYGDFVPVLTTVKGSLRMLAGSTWRSAIVDSANGPYARYVFAYQPVQLTDCTLNLAISPNANIAPGSTFAIIRGSATGTFNGLPEGTRFILDGHSLTISYTNDVVLTVDSPFVWDGGGTDNRWTTAANWVGNVAPIADSALEFPINVAKRFVTNDFASGTRFRSLIFSGPDYFVYGNPLQLTGETIDSAGSGQTLVNLDIMFVDDSSPVSVQGTSVLRLDGLLSGASIRKLGSGTLRLGGTANNTQSGIEVWEGELRLGKVGAIAVAGNLTIGDQTTAAFVNLLGNNQIADNAVVTVRKPAHFHLNGSFDTIGSLNGSGTVTMGLFEISPRLVVAGGGFSGNITGNGGLTKTGSGTLTLGGSNTFTRSTILADGVIQIDGVLANSPILLNGGVLRGRGRVNTISGNLGGTVSPGLGGAAFQNYFYCGDLELNGSTTFQPLLTSSSPEFEARRLQVTGTVNLGGSTLNLQTLAGFTPPTNKTFVIIDNDGADAITGTFSGLAEGAVFGSGPLVFRISYVGGSGNDVTVTRVAAPASDLTSIQSLGNGEVMIQGLGINGLVYDIQATSNLNSVTSWILIGRGTGDMSGVFQFIHSNAPTIPRRFYRAVTP